MPHAPMAPHPLSRTAAAIVRGCARLFLFLLLVATLFASTSGWSTSLTTIHAASAGTTAHATASNAKHAPDLRDESAWFQLKHVGAHLPSVNARSIALAKANALPHAHFGQPSQVAKSGKNAQTGGVAAAGAQPAPNDGAWTPLGPAPEAYSTCCWQQNNSGRITSVAVNPQNSNDIWIGSADGGVWNSLSGGANWAPMTDSQPTLSIGAIAIDPNNPQIIYVGTGEANFNDDGFPGAGILKSIDHGQTWTQYGASQFTGLTIGKLIVDPTNSNTLLAAVSLNAFSSSTDGNLGLPADVSVAQTGIWRSIDGGQTWTQALGKPMSSNLASATDIVFDPTNHYVVYAGFGQTGSIGSNPSCPCLWKSTNNGALGSWTAVSSPVLPDGSVSLQRVALNISQDGQYFYAVLVSANSSDSTKSDLYSSAIYVSDHTATNWRAVPLSPNIANDEGEDQWFYDAIIATDPTNSQIAYLGGVGLYQTTDGGSSWSLAPGFQGGLTHADQHALSFLNATSSQFILGNDGGVWAGSSGANAYTDLNGANGSGLDITQLYGASVGLAGADAQIYAGSQDNDILQYPAGSNGEAQWNELQTGSTNGDGGQVAVDFTNNAIVYAEQSRGELYRSSDGGNAWKQIGGGDVNGLNSCGQASSSSCDPTNWIMPFALAPSNHDEIFAGTDKLYRSTNDGQSWSTLGNLDSTSFDNTRSLSALAVGSQSDSAIYVGDNTGEVFASSDGGATWEQNHLTGSAGGMVTGLAIDPLNAAVVYATIANFAKCAPNVLACGQHIFRSTDGGGSWTDLDPKAQLPNIPFESVVVDPLNNNTIFIGTDAGIFDTSDVATPASAGGPTWYQVFGLPKVAVEQMFTDSKGTQLYVATHGRGLWRVPLVSGTVYAAQAGVVGGASSTCTGTDYAYADASLDGSRQWTFSDAIGMLPGCPSPDALLLANGVLYFVDGETSTGGSLLFALDDLSGRVIWQITLPYVSYGNDALSYLNGTLFVGGDKLYALNATSGAILWSTQLAKATKRTPAPTAGAVLSSSGVVYTNGSDGYLYAFDSSTGAKVWTSTSQESATALANGTLYVTTPSAYLQALNASTRVLQWQAQYQVAGQTWSPWGMTVVNGVIYVASSVSDTYYGTGFDNAMLAINATTGTLLWSASEGWGQEYLGIPAVANGLVYDGGNDLYAWQATTGAIAWTNSGLGTDGQEVTGSPVVGNDVLYIRTYGYGLYALNPLTGMILWTEPTYGVSTFGVDLLIGGTS